VKNCYATGDVTVASAIAPICAGGLIGKDCRIVGNCYAIGDVTATGSLSVYAGGLFGRFEGERVTRCYCLSSQKVVGDTINDLGEPLTSAEMKKQQSFVTWDFDTVWEISSKTNNGYPTLRGLAANKASSSGGSSSNNPSNGSSSDESGLLDNPLVPAGVALAVAVPAAIAYVLYKKKKAA
jgi:hypothetical protein